MANTVLLKKSSVAAKVPLVTDLVYGEAAINYTDGKLYYKTAGNTIDYFPSATSTATLTNKTLSSPTLNGTVTINGLVYPTTDGSTGQVLTTNGSGTLSWSTVSGGGGAMPSTYTGYAEYGVSSISTSTTVYSFPIATYRSAKYFITITSGTNYGAYEFMVAHDGTTVYLSGSNTDYVTSGTSVNYFSGDYVESLLDENTRIEIGTMSHSLNWTISAGNLVFSAAATSGTINVKGTVTLIKV